MLYIHAWHPSFLRTKLGQNRPHWLRKILCTSPLVSLPLHRAVRNCLSHLSSSNYASNPQWRPSGWSSFFFFFFFLELFLDFPQLWNAANDWLESLKNSNKENVHFLMNKEICIFAKLFYWTLVFKWTDRVHQPPIRTGIYLPGMLLRKVKLDVLGGGGGRWWEKWGLPSAFLKAHWA